MSQTFFFYDLETSGLNARSDRIMQFAGQRTDASLKPIGEPMNCLIKLTEDILPSPEALMVTGITPQKPSKKVIRKQSLFKLYQKKFSHPKRL
jgi:exodeoxyribonuclease-1